MAQKPKRRTKPRKTARPQVIDLEAEEVAEADGNAEPAHDAVADTASDDAASVPSSDEGAEAPAAQDEPATVENADSAETDAAGDAGDADTDEPVQPPAEDTGSAGNRGKLIAAGLAALIIAGGAGAWLYRAYGDGNAGASAAQIEALQQQLADVRKSNELNAQNLRKLESTLSALQSSSQQALSSLEQSGATRAETMQAELDELTSAIANASKDGNGGAAGQAANAMKIEALENGLAEAANKLSSLEGKIDAMPTGADEDLKAQLAAMVAQLDALRAEQEARATKTVSALGQSFGQLTSAVASGSAFTEQLDALVTTAPTLPGIADLRSVADTGVPSNATLADQLDNLAADVEARRADATASANEQGGMFSALTAQLTKVVKIRKVGEIDWPELLKASAGMVRQGELAAVADALTAKLETAPEGVSEWLKQANSRLAIDAAMQKLSDAVLRQLAASGIGG